MGTCGCRAGGSFSPLLTLEGNFQPVAWIDARSSSLLEWPAAVCSKVNMANDDGRAAEEGECVR